MDVQYIIVWFKLKKMKIIHNNIYILLMNDKKCKNCNKPQLNTHKNALIINKKICNCKVIKQDEELNYDLKNLIKELIIHKYFT